LGHRDPVLLFAYRKDNVAYVRLVGSLTMQNFEDILGEINHLLTDPPEILYLMMRDIRYLDSAGLGMFVRLNTRCRATRTRLHLLDPSPDVARLLSLSKMDLIIPIERGGAARTLRNELENDAYAIDVSGPGA
jgi:anti-anti-sigma factor